MEHAPMAPVQPRIEKPQIIQSETAPKPAEQIHQSWTESIQFVFDHPENGFLQNRGQKPDKSLIAKRLGTNDPTKIDAEAKRQERLGEAYETLHQDQELNDRARADIDTQLKKYVDEYKKSHGDKAPADADLDAARLKIQTEVISTHFSADGLPFKRNALGQLSKTDVVPYKKAIAPVVGELERLAKGTDSKAQKAREILEVLHFDPKQEAFVIESGSNSEHSASDLVDRAKLFLKGKLSDESGPFSEKVFKERPPEAVANHQKAFGEIGGEKGTLKREIKPEDTPEAIIAEINSQIPEEDKKWKYNKDNPNDPTVQWVRGAITEAQAQAVQKTRSFIETTLPQLNNQATSPDGVRYTAQIRSLLEQAGTEGKALLDEYNQKLQLNGQTRDQYVTQKVKEAKDGKDLRDEKEIEKAYSNAFDKNATLHEEKPENEKKLTLEQESVELNKAINLAMEFTDQFLIEGRRKEPRKEVVDMLTKLNLARANPDKIFRGTTSGETGKSAYLLFQRAVVKEFNEKFLNNQFVNEDQRGAMQAQLGDITPLYEGDRSVVPKEALQQDVADLFRSHLTLRGRSTEQIGQLLKTENYAETMSTIFSASLEGNNTKAVLGMSEITSGVANQWDKDDTQMLTQLTFGNLQQDEEWWRSSGELGQKYLKVDNNIFAMLNRFRDRWGGILAFCVLFKLQEITSFDAAPAQQGYPA